MAIFAPSNFRTDWYGWLTNQISHVGLGVFGVWGMSLLAFLMFGEMPYKSAVFVTFSGLYVLHELRIQRWQGFDTIEDCIFTCAYGAGGTLMAFSELAPGMADVIVDISAPLPFLAACGFHLLIGAALRALLKGRINDG